jgi:hypothetical protein
LDATRAGKGCPDASGWLRSNDLRKSHFDT